jgi:hypothetical protein
MVVVVVVVVVEAAALAEACYLLTLVPTLLVILRRCKPASDPVAVRHPAPSDEISRRTRGSGKRRRRTRQ